MLTKSLQRAALTLTAEAKKTLLRTSAVNRTLQEMRKSNDVYARRCQLEIYSR